MKKAGAESLSQVSIEARYTPEGIRVSGSTYNLLFRADKPFVELRDMRGETWSHFSQLSRLDATRDVDETLGVQPAEIGYDEGITSIRFPVRSTLWEAKVQVWKCHDDFIEMYHEVVGQEDLVAYELFGGHVLGPKSGTFPSRKEFTDIFNPEPTASEKPLRSADEAVSINVTGTSRPGHMDWFATPAPWCYGFQKDDKFLMAGIAAPIEEQNFISYDYQPHEDSFSLSLDYQGHTRIDGAFRTPSVFLQFSDDPYEGLGMYARTLIDRGIAAPVVASEQPTWWRQPMFCGWGEQAECADTASGITAQDLSTETFYDSALRTLEDNDIWPQTITIDDKWQRFYGINGADTDKWPDLARWIGVRHTLGQKVLLWLKPLDPEGVDPALCIRTPDGTPVAIDPTNPQWREHAHERIRHMIGKDGYDADGLKIDFTADVPSGRHYQYHGDAWGAALLHQSLTTIYQSVKQIKPDALVVTHTPNPQFADISDMWRLNDINTAYPVVSQMQHRARVARAVSPGMLIDTDDWPMPSIEEWREYLRLKPSLGVAALYFATTVAGSPLTPEDYGALRNVGFVKPAL